MAAPANSTWVGYFGAAPVVIDGSTTVFTGNVAVTGQFIGPAADNTAAPPFTFSGDLNSGIASAAADTVNVVTGGTSRLAVSTTAVTSTLPILTPSGSAANPGLAFASGPSNGLRYGDPGFIASVAGADRVYFGGNFQARSDVQIGWAASTDPAAALDTLIHRVGAGVTGVRGANTTSGGALNFLEQTAPGAPAANQVVLYAQDNGAGKTQLMARFNSGAAQQIAIEP